MTKYFKTTQNILKTLFIFFKFSFLILVALCKNLFVPMACCVAHQNKKWTHYLSMFFLHLFNLVNIAKCSNSAFFVLQLYLFLTFLLLMALYRRLTTVYIVRTYVCSCHSIIWLGFCLQSIFFLTECGLCVA